MGNDVKPKTRDRGNAWAGFSGKALMPWCVGISRSECVKIANKIYGERWDGQLTFHRVRISRVD